MVCIPDQICWSCFLWCIKKTNYSAWRDMKSWHGADIWINGGKYTVEDIDCPFNYHDFDAKDGSFGQYIRAMGKPYVECSKCNIAFEI